MSSAPRKKERSSDGSTRVICKLPGCEKPTWPNDRELETAKTYHHQRYHQESARIIYQGRCVEIRRDPATGRFPCPCGEPQHARRMAINTRTLCRPQVHPPPDTPSAGEAATDDEGFGYRRATGTQSSGGAGMQGSGGAGSLSSGGAGSLSSGGAGSLSSGGSGSQSFSAGTRSAQSGRPSAGGPSYQPPAAGSNAKSTANAAGRTRSAASASTSAPKPASASVPNAASAPLPRKRPRGSPEVIEVGSDSEDGGTVLVKRVKREPVSEGDKPIRCTHLKPIRRTRPIRRTVSASPDAEDRYEGNDEGRAEADDEDMTEVDEEDKVEVNDKEKPEVDEEDKVEVEEEDKVKADDEGGAEPKDESGAMEQSDEEDRGPRKEARARRQEEARGRPRSDAALTGAQGEGGAAMRAAEDAACGRRETKTERELTLEEKFERNRALERKLHEQLDKQYEAYQEKLRAMQALMS
ncbi:hypothetical protein GGG16DRAFT_114305 [Schizophyllum commune]